MAARSMGALTVAFGLVSIPCKIYNATDRSKAVSFNLMTKDGKRLKQQYVQADDATKVVERADMVKGYEFAKDQYVMFTPEELKSMEETGTHCADIVQFVPLDAVDPVYFEKAMYLAPEKGAAKPYALLHDALTQSGRCAIGKWAARGRGYVVLIRPSNGALVMQVMYYAHEVRAVSDITIDKAQVSEKELALALQLVEAQSSDEFDMTQFADEVTARVQAAIEAKVEGKELVVATAAAPTAQVIDLAAALQASLAAKPAKSKAPAAKAPAKKAKAA